MKKILLLAAFLVCVMGSQAFADYSFSFVGTDSNGWAWDLTGILQTTVISGQTYVTGGNLQEATGAGYAYSGTDFQVLGLSVLPTLQNVPGSGGANFDIDNKFNPTSNPFFTSEGIDLANSVGTSSYYQSPSNPSGYAAPYVNIWGNSPGQYQLLYDSPMNGSGEGYTTPTIAATVEVAPVPIPGAFLLLGPGLVGLAAIRRRFKN